MLQTGAINPFLLIFICAFMLVVTAIVVAFTQAQRKIPVQYAKRIMGRKMYGGHTTHLPAAGDRGRA